MNEDLTLVVGDAHVAPEQMKGNKLRRFTWLGKLIDHKKPSRVVFIGDFLTMDSLSAWDKDKRKRMEGKRYSADIACGQRALENMFIQINPKLCSKIEWVYLKGNHEYRLDRYLDKDPTFVGHADIVKDLGIDNWTIVEYKDNYEYKGVSFTHIPITEGGTALSAGGHTSIAKKSLDLYESSIVFGHTHKMEVACKHRHGARSLQQSLNVGCFFEHVEDYALGSMTSYWRGLVLLNHYDKGRFDVQTFSIGRLSREYGNARR